MAGYMGSTFANDYLQLIFNAVTITGLARDDAAPIANLYISLHTADPTAGGNQASSEATYGGYARIAVARTAGGWTVTTNSVANFAQLTVPSWASGATNTLTYFAIGTVVAPGAGKILYGGPLTNPVVMSAGNPTATIAAGGVTVTVT